VCAISLAVVPSASVASDLGAYLASTPTLLGGRDGPRERTRDAGLDLRVYSVNFLADRVSGAAGTDSEWRYSGSVDYFLVADLDRLVGIPGGLALLQAKSRYGRSVNPTVAALVDPIDDADGDRSLEIAQLWYEQTFWRGRASLRLGFLDQQTLVDRNAYANSEDTQFLSTALDNQNAVVPLAIGLGAALVVDVWHERLTMIASVGDASGRSGRAGWQTAFDEPADFLGYLELGYHESLPMLGARRPGTYRVGVVIDPRSRDEIGRPGRTTALDAGVYASVDQAIWAEPADPSQGLGVFLRYGYREPDVNPITYAWSVGLQYAGLAPRRDRDVIGVGLYGVHASPRLRTVSATPVRREIGGEAYYRVDVTPWLALTPDLQYVHDPGGLRGSPDAWVCALRVRLTF